MSFQSEGGKSAVEVSMLHINIEQEIFFKHKFCRFEFYG
jgi:hypothetical protein